MAWEQEKRRSVTVTPNITTEIQRYKDGTESIVHANYAVSSLRTWAFYNTYFYALILSSTNFDHL